MAECYQEECPNWSGDGRVCPCVAMGIEPEDGPGAPSDLLEDED